MDDLFEQLKAAPPVNKNVKVLPKSTSGKKIMARPSLQGTTRLSPRRESLPSTSSSVRLQKLSKDNKSRSMSPPQFSTPIKQIRPFKVLISRKSLSSANNTPVKGGDKKNPVPTAATIKTTDKKASIRSSHSSQLPNVTANTPTKAQKKQFIATTMPSVLPKSRREETRKQKPKQLTKKKLATKRCEVRLPQRNLQRLQKQFQGKDLNVKEQPIRKVPANPTKSKEIQKRKSLGVEKSLLPASLNSTLAKIVSVSKLPFIKSDRLPISSIPKRGRVSDPPTTKAGSLPNLSTPNRSGSVSSTPSSKDVSLENSSPAISKRGLLTSSSASKRGRLSSSSPSKRGRLSSSPPSKRVRLSNSPPSKRGRLSNSPTSKQNRCSSTSPSKAQTGFYIKINPTPSSLLRLQKSKEKTIDKSQTKHSSKLQTKTKIPTSASSGQNMKTSPTGRTKATKFTRTQLIKAFGKRVFQSHVRIKRCRHPLMVTFDSNARARKTQAKHNKSKKLSVSFREQVEILGSIDTDEESIDVENYIPKVCSFGKISAPSPPIANPAPAATTEAATQSTSIVTPARLKKVENGKVIDDIEFDPSQFILPNAVNQSVAITGYSSTPYSPGYKKREKKSFSPLKGDSISPRREEFKLANEKLPPSGLRRLQIDYIDEDDDDCEYIVPIDFPQRHTSHAISVAVDESSGSFVSATDEPTVDSKTDSSHVTDEIFQSPLKSNKDNDKPSMQDNDAPVDLVKKGADLEIPKLTRIQESPTASAVDWNKLCAAIVIEDQLTKNENLYDSKEGGTATTATTTNTTNNSTSREDNALPTVNVSAVEVLDEEASKDENVIDKLLNESLDDITAKDFELPSLSVKDDGIMITDDIIEEISPKDFELPPLIVHDLELSSLGIQDVATKVSKEEVITNATTTLAETCLH